jgi:hypothetical protein
MNLMSRANALNTRVAILITNGVSTMWCAYAFAAISLTSLKPTLEEHSVTADVQWVAQTFLQLVLLSVIMVGQKVQADSLGDLHDKHDALHDRLDSMDKTG